MAGKQEEKEAVDYHWKLTLFRVSARYDEESGQTWQKVNHTFSTLDFHNFPKNTLIISDQCMHINFIISIFNRILNINYQSYLSESSSSSFGIIDFIILVNRDSSSSL